MAASRILPTEALYVKARLLYLGTGRLGNVARELRSIESAGDKIRSMGSLFRRVLRRMEDTQVELNSTGVLPCRSPPSPRPAAP